MYVHQVLVPGGLTPRPSVERTLFLGRRRLKPLQQAVHVEHVFAGAPDCRERKDARGAAVVGQDDIGIQRAGVDMQ